MKKYLKLKVNGSYSIEISLIMPIVIGVILIILYLSMYIYDKCVFEYALTKILAYTYSTDEYARLATDVDDILLEVLDSNTIMQWDIAIVTSDYDGEISVEVTANTKYSQGLIDSIVSNNLFKIHEHITIPNGNELEYVRRQNDI